MARAVHTASPRKLRRTGIIALVHRDRHRASRASRYAANHAPEVAQWTEAQAMPTVVVLTQQGVSRPADGAAREPAGLVRGADLCTGQRLPEEVVFRLSARTSRRAQCSPTSTHPISTPSSQAAHANLEGGACAGEGPRGRDAVRAHDLRALARFAAGVVSEQERESKKADFDSAQAQYNAALADVNSAQGGSTGSRRSSSSSASSRRSTAS